MRNIRYAIIFLLSMAIISLETIWTRVFSAEFFYTFSFLIISLVILGLGLGGLALRLGVQRQHAQRLWLWLLLAGLFASAAPVALVQLNIEFGSLYREPIMGLKFVAALIPLGAPFFLSGMALAELFRTDPKNMPRLYMADLLGAGAGIIVALLLMNSAGTLAAVFLAVIPLLLASLLAAHTWLRAIPAIVILASILVIPLASPLLERQREERAPVIYTHWDAMSKIKIYEFSEAYRGINIDNAANSPVIKFDGNWNVPDSAKIGFAIDVGNLIARFDSCTFMSLGAGGGGDVLQALQYGCTEVHAVEVNPHINWLLTDGDLAEYSGNIYNDPRVNVVTEDARTYVKRHPGTFDMIYSLSSNTFAALASGSFALAENYLFTTGAFADYYNALSDSGFMMMEHQFYMPRMVTEIMQALESLGLENPLDYFAIYDLPQLRRNMLLLSKRPLTDEIIKNAFGELGPENYAYIHTLYPAPDSTADNLVNRIVTEGWRNVQPDAAIDLSPCPDHRPFTAQLGLWKNLDLNGDEDLKPWEFMGFPLSKLLIVTILIIITVLVLPINIIPFFIKNNRMGAAAWLYFFSIGIGFMVVEVVLIQWYTLYIGPSTYTFATVLFAMLIGSGIGSRFSDRFRGITPYFWIVVLVMAEMLVLPLLINHTYMLNMTARMALAALTLLPLSFFMGMPFAKGGQKAGEYVDWGFAVNGTASVLGSTAIMLVSFSYGFYVSLLVGAVFYVMAMLLYKSNKGWI